MNLLLTLLFVILVVMFATVLSGKSRKWKTFLLVAFLGVIIGTTYNKVFNQDTEKESTQTVIDNHDSDANVLFDAYNVKETVFVDTTANKYPVDVVRNVSNVITPHNSENITTASQEQIEVDSS